MKQCTNGKCLGKHGYSAGQAFRTTAPETYVATSDIVGTERLTEDSICLLTNVRTVGGLNNSICLFELWSSERQRHILASCHFFDTWFTSL